MPPYNFRLPESYIQIAQIEVHKEKIPLGWMADIDSYFVYQYKTLFYQINIQQLKASKDTEFVMETQELIESFEPKVIHGRYLLVPQAFISVKGA